MSDNHGHRALQGHREQRQPVGLHKVHVPSPFTLQTVVSGASQAWLVRNPSHTTSQKKGAAGEDTVSSPKSHLYTRFLLSGCNAAESLTGNLSAHAAKL